MNLNLTPQTSKPQAETPEKSFSVQLLLILGVLLCLSAGGVWGYERILEHQVQSLQTKIEGKKQAISELRAANDDAYQASAAAILKKAQDARTTWSHIIESILNTEMTGVQFSNFNYHQGQVSVQATAINMDTLTRFIRTLKKDPATENPFISSLQKSSRMSGGEISFQLNFLLAPQL